MDNSYPKTRESAYALMLLLSAYIFSFIDRNIMAMLIGPIRESFNISDFEYSLLHGVAFTMLYITLGLPIGRLADHHRRTWIISAGVFFWSLMTCLCGFAKGFFTLFLARMGVGVGEAALSPPAYSLLSDLFPPERLRWATSIFGMGITLGGGLAYMIGGNIYEYFANGNNLPGFSALNAWQQTFVAVGAPGVLIAVLIAFLKEPQRMHSTSAEAVSSTDSLSVREIIDHIKSHRVSYFTIFAMVSLMSLIGYGTSAWYPEFLQRNHGMSRIATGNHIGWIAIIAGSAGMFFGAGAATLLHRRGYSDANLRVVAIITSLLIIPGPLSTLINSVNATLALWWVVVFIHYGYFGVSMAALMAITPNRMRAQIAALLLFSANLFGLALGATAVAALTDFVFQDDAALKYSLSLLMALLYPISALIVIRGLKAYRESIRIMTPVVIGPIETVPDPDTLT